jgi:hypothetical protein
MSVSSVQSTPLFVCQAIENTVTDNDGIRTIGELAYSILYLLQATLENVPTSYIKVCDAFGSFININYAVSFMNRIYELTVEVEDGKLLWDYPHSYIASSLTLAIAGIANIIWLLDELGCYVLGVVWNPIICNFSAVFTAISGLFEGLYYYEEITAGNEKITKAEYCAKIWTERSQKLTDDQIDQIIKKWQERLDVNPNDERISRICFQWRAIKNHPQERATFCSQKARNWQIIAENQKITNIQNWIGVAICIGDIALTIIPMIFPAPTLPAVVIGLAIADVIENITCMTSYMMGHLWLTSPIHEISFPGTPKVVINHHSRILPPLPHHGGRNIVVLHPET